MITLAFEPLNQYAHSKFSNCSNPNFFFVFLSVSNHGRGERFNPYRLLFKQNVSVFHSPYILQSISPFRKAVEISARWIYSPFLLTFRLPTVVLRTALPAQKSHCSRYHLFDSIYLQRNEPYSKQDCHPRPTCISIHPYTGYSFYLQVVGIEFKYYFFQLSSTLPPSRASSHPFHCPPLLLPNILYHPPLAFSPTKTGRASSLFWWIFSVQQLFYCLPHIQKYHRFLTASLTELSSVSSSSISSPLTCVF